jgi:hypothetical protein
MLAPVSKEVHAVNLPSETLVEGGNKRASDGASQVKSIKLLADVRRRKFDNDSFTLAARVSGVFETLIRGLAILRGAIDNGGENYTWKRLLSEEEADMDFVGEWLGKQR